jgi:hypothetical protein
MTQLAAEITPFDDNVLLPRPLAGTDRQVFNSHRYVHLDNLWRKSFSDALSDEAFERHAFARLPEAGPRTPVDERRLIRKQTPAATGPLLSRLHVSLIGLVRTLSGQPTWRAVPRSCGTG